MNSVIRPAKTRKFKTKRNPVILAVLVLLLVSGTSLMLYPCLMQTISQKQAEQTNREFLRQMADEYSPEEKDELYLKMVEYNRILFESNQHNLVDAFAYEQPDFILTEYGFAEEMIGYVQIPKMEIELPIYLGANRENLNNGVAHLTQTSLPVGGVNTNAVLAAHRGMPTAAMFRDLEKLEIDDIVYIVNFRETLTYQVVETAIILPSEIDKILIQPGRDLISLVSCHPYGHNYQRYVVYAERME